MSWWAYDMGRDRAAAQHGSLDERLTAVEEENRRLREEAQDAGAVVTRAEEQLADIRRRYRADVPEGVERELLEATRRRVAEGVAPDRLMEVVNAVRAETGCEPDVRTRRFLVRTPVSPSGGGASVNVADGGFVVTGAGVSAVNTAGNPEAWFDPGPPGAYRLRESRRRRTRGRGCSAPAPQRDRRRRTLQFQPDGGRLAGFRQRLRAGLRLSLTPCRGGSERAWRAMRRASATRTRLQRVGTGASPV